VLISPCLAHLIAPAISVPCPAKEGERLELVAAHLSTLETHQHEARASTAASPEGCPLLHHPHNPVLSLCPRTACSLQTSNEDRKNF